MLRTLAAAALLIGAHTAAHADVYRWVDAQGQVQYSDRWVPGSVLVKVDKAKEDAAAAAAAQAKASEALAASNQRIADEQVQKQNLQAVKQDVAKAQADRCPELTERYNKSVQAQRIYRTNKDGEREYVPPEQADAYRAKARAEMLAACGKEAK